MNVTMTVNGAAHSIDVAPNRLLVEVLREDLGLTGTHVGCDTSQCGACTVRLDGRAVKACTVLAAQAQGAQVTTIEGLGGDAGGKADEALHPMQAAFHECHALQCGFCTPGFVMAAVDLIERAKAEGRKLDDAELREGLAGNICRCTGYQNILRAVESAAQRM